MIYKLYNADSKDILANLDENSIDSLITDPPAGISFMGKDWDDYGSLDNFQLEMREIFSENSKYKLLQPYMEINGHILHQIQALKSFSDVKKGDVGGWIESVKNLSQEGNCWIYEDSRVYENAKILNNAQIREHIRVYGNAIIGDASVIDGNADIYGNVHIGGNSILYLRDESIIKDNVRILGSAFITGKVHLEYYAVINEHVKIEGTNVRISGLTVIGGHAFIADNAIIKDEAVVAGDCKVTENAVISNAMHIFYGTVNKDLTNKKNLAMNIKAQTGLHVEDDGTFIAYKHVNKDLSSLHDPKFKYKVGKVISAKNPDLSNESCSSGLHVSNPNYWNDHGGKVLLTCLCNIKDVITVQDGKIRMKKLKVLSKSTKDIF